MNLTGRIAFRYLFGRKSSQAIHWITGISILGISVGSAALILVLSVFNGFEELLSGLFSKYNPDVKIVLKVGKTFREDSATLLKLGSLPGVAVVARSLEEVALFQYGDAQEFGILKGVDDGFTQVCAAEEAVLEGEFALERDGTPLANVGLGIRNKLGISLQDFQEFVQVFVPDREEDWSPTSAPKRFPMQAQSVYTFHQEGDYSTIITSLDAVRQVLKRQGQLSALDVKLSEPSAYQQVIPAIEELMGPEFIVKDRYRQDEAFLKIMKLEKWLFYALFSLTLILVSFTIVGALWMIVLEKRMDISILKSMGLTNPRARNIFIALGLFICFLGLLLGFLAALLFYFLQKQYGLIGVPEEFIIDSYPIQVRLLDFLLVSGTVLAIGLLASLLPAKKVSEIQPIFREE
ncbi:MAG TPA: FtsX-like permease family protein [Saprospiraceae bacterium]|nr:FtsX-like permease family protein [Saprospiraceae bacterium]